MEQAIQQIVGNPVGLEKLRVLLDSRKIFDGGIGVYIQNLIFGIKYNNQISLTILVTKEDYRRLKLTKPSILDGISVEIDNSKLYSLDEYLFLGKRINKSKYDLFHSPHWTLPFGLKIPSIITIHDLIHIKQPEKFFYPFVAKNLIKTALKRTKKVITVSQSSANDLLANFKKELLAKKLEIVPNSLKPEYSKVIKKNNFLEKKFGLKQNYLLAVFSNTKPHKCIKELIYIFDKLKKTSNIVPENLQLVLVGMGIERLAENNNLLNYIEDKEDLKLLGKVPDEDLLFLYNQADALIVPSKAEGFCLPVLEAHSQGTPVIVRPVPAILELLTEHDTVASGFSGKELEKAVENFYGKLKNKSKNEQEQDCESIRSKAMSYDCFENGKNVVELYLSIIKK